MVDNSLSSIRKSKASKLNDIKWTVVDTHLAYRFVSDNFIEVLTTEMFESKFGDLVSYTFNVVNRVGAISTLDEKSVYEFLKARNMENYTDEDFMKEFEVPKAVFILHNMEYEKGGRKNFIEAILNKEPMNNDKTVTFIKEHIRLNGGQ